MPQLSSITCQKHHRSKLMVALTSEVWFSQCQSLLVCTYVGQNIDTIR